jgi:hypothetical protein
MPSSAFAGIRIAAPAAKRPASTVADSIHLNARCPVTIIPLVNTLPALPEFDKSVVNALFTHFVYVGQEQSPHLIRFLRPGHRRAG